jgi:hypothetical protein
VLHSVSQTGAPPAPAMQRHPVDLTALSSAVALHCLTHTHSSLGGRADIYELTTRWTMGMKLGWVPFAAFWTPEFVFTGTSIMGISPSTGKFISHVDTWDSIQNQEFLSADAVKDLIAQILQVHRCAPSLRPAAAAAPPFLNFWLRSVSHW